MNARPSAEPDAPRRSHRTEADAIVETVRGLATPTFVNLGTPDAVPDEGPFALVVPKDLELRSVKRLVDEWRTRPERRSGTAQLKDLDSFIAHVNRFKDPASAIFADPDPKAPALLCVLDYHAPVNTAVAGAAYSDPDAEPRFGVHRARYGFPLSDEWLAWLKWDGEAMGQGEFAGFLEDRIQDVMPPPDWKALTPDGNGPDGETPKLSEPDKALKHFAELVGGNFAGPAKLLELARGLNVHVGETVKQAVNLNTGEIRVQYEASHKAEGDAGPVVVPSLFLIAIPVFRLGALYRIAVRLRYRVAGGKIVWFYQLHRHERVFDDAVREAATRARDETSLPLFMGLPEGTASAAS